MSFLNREKGMEDCIMAAKQITLEELAKKVPRATFMNDWFLGYAMNNNLECAQTIVRIILGKEDITVKECIVQKTIPFLRHEVRLDVKATDKNGKIYNIEIQNKDYKHLPKRLRYYSSMQDMELLEKGKGYHSIPEVYVIFLLKKDHFGKGKPIYHFQMKEVEDNILENDGIHHLYVNVKHKFSEKNSLSDLCHDLNCAKPEKMVYNCFRETMSSIKGNEKERDKMLNLSVQDFFNDGFRQGEEKGKEKGKIETIIETIRNMQRNQYKDKDMAICLGMSLEELAVFMKEHKEDLL